MLRQELQEVYAARYGMQGWRDYPIKSSFKLYFLLILYNKCLEDLFNKILKSFSKSEQTFTS